MVGITDLHDTLAMEESRPAIRARLQVEEAARILDMLKMGRVGGKKTKTNKRRKKSSHKKIKKTRKNKNKKK